MFSNIVLREAEQRTKAYVHRSESTRPADATFTVFVGDNPCLPEVLVLAEFQTIDFPSKKVKDGAEQTYLIEKNPSKATKVQSIRVVQYKVCRSKISLSLTTWKKCNEYNSFLE